MTALRAALRRRWVLGVAGLLALGAVAAAGAGARATGPTSSASLKASAYTAAIGRASPSSRLVLELPLVADDAGLARFATAVSTPSSPLYGDFASVRSLNARFGARPGVAAAVQRYLRRAGARDVSLDSVGQYISATMTVAAAQRTFATDLARFRDARGQEYIAPAGLARGAAGAPPLPAALRGRVTGVVGLDTQSLTAPQEPAVSRGLSTPASVAGPIRARAAGAQRSSAYWPRSGTAGGCRGARHTGAFTPNQYLTAYGYRDLQSGGLQGQGERAALIEIDGFRGSDINGFVRCFRVPYPHLRVLPVGGLRRPLAPGGEATLDIELMTAAAPRLSDIYVYESKGSAGQVLHAYSAALARGRRPQVISASLGICEPLALSTMGLSGIRAIERILQTAAGSGVSVLASAGDQGSSACVLSGHIQRRLAVSYPASSPFVTGVGGTNVLLDRSNHIRGEIAWNDTTAAPDAGGGGISRVFGAPRFQAGTVSSPGRAVPDVSMLADLGPGYAIFCTAKSLGCGTGGWTGAGGTSAATPLLAAGIALVDQDRRRHHRHGLGDLNPLLYYLGHSTVSGAVYDDILNINNDLGPYLRKGDHRPLGCCAAGHGFDEASGWGSVNVSALAQIVAPPA